MQKKVQNDRAKFKIFAFPVVTLIFYVLFLIFVGDFVLRI